MIFTENGIAKSSEIIFALASDFRLTPTLSPVFVSKRPLYICPSILKNNAIEESREIFGEVILAKSFLTCDMV